jgi:hypothetical protein
VIRCNLGTRPTREQLRAIRLRAEAHESEHYSLTGPATCPQCGGRFWSYDRRTVMACEACNPPTRSDPMGGRPKLPEAELARIAVGRVRRPRVLPADPAEAERRRLLANEQSRRSKVKRGLIRFSAKDQHWSK